MTRLAAKAAAIDEPNDKLQTPLHFAAFYQHSKDILLHYASFFTFRVAIAPAYLLES